MSTAVTTRPEGAGATEHHLPSPRPGGDAPHVRSTAERFGRDHAEVGRARALIRRSLTAWGLSGEVASLQLAGSELVTNALVHGSGEVEVQLAAVGGLVRLEVVDEGSDTSPQVARAGESDRRGGWGLLVVEQVADRWGAETGPAGTRVWMERRVRDDPADRS